jgi:hypothetical protein
LLEGCRPRRRPTPDLEGDSAIAGAVRQAEPESIDFQQLALGISIRLLGPFSF